MLGQRMKNKEKEKEQEGKVGKEGRSHHQSTAIIPKQVLFLEISFSLYKNRNTEHHNTAKVTTIHGERKKSFSSKTFVIYVQKTMCKYVGGGQCRNGKKKKESRES
jgi:hypothetical protein